MPTGNGTQNGAAEKDHGAGWRHGNNDSTAEPEGRRFPGDGIQRTFMLSERKQRYAEHYKARCYLPNTQGTHTA